MRKIEVSACINIFNSDEKVKPHRLYLYNIRSALHDSYLNVIDLFNLMLLSKILKQFSTL